METSQRVGPSQSPSFNTYSSQSPLHNQTLTDIAARVIHELNLPHSDPFSDHRHPAADEDSDFEFAVLRGGDNHPSSPISADEIFSNGQIKPLYSNPSGPGPGPNPPVRLPLRRLLIEERENSTASCSSSEGDELEGVPPESYCVWDPTKKRNDDGVLKKKSKSAGSHSKRWRIRDLLYRSHSDGGKVEEEGSFVFSQGDDVAVEKRRGRDAGKRRLDVIGFFANANGISRTVRPF